MIRHDKWSLVSSVGRVGRGWTLPCWRLWSSHTLDHSEGRRTEEIRICGAAFPVFVGPRVLFVSFFKRSITKFKGEGSQTKNGVRSMIFNSQKQSYLILGFMKNNLKSPSSSSILLRLGDFAVSNCIYSYYLFSHRIFWKKRYKA